MKGKFNEIGDSLNVFCILSEGAQHKLSSEEYMGLSYEEVFVNLVNHVVMKYGPDGTEWLRKMALEWIGCVCSDTPTKIMIKDLGINSND